MRNYNQKQLSYKINFYAVGQGLFSSGHINIDNDIYNYNIDLIKAMFKVKSDEDKEEFVRDIRKDLYHRPRSKKFHFIYDCGTLSSQNLIIKQIDNEFRKNMNNTNINGKNIIDLLAISHFDKDHISGLDYLFSKYKVKTILLPFVDLPHRLFLAFYYKVDIQSKFMEFFINPAKYLLKNYKGKIEKIILVPPSNDNDKKDDTPINLESIEIKNLRFSVIDIDRSSTIPIFTLAPKSSMIIENIFQFIPYNDASTSSALTPIFINEVKKQKEKILDKSGSSSDFALTIKVIKKLYDKEFGKSGKKRNIISLFLFASPLNHISEVIEACQYNDNLGIERDKDFSLSPMKKNKDKNAILYTGDGYLDNEIRLKNLRDYLGEENFQKIACLQVMHHGAESCWYEGLAEDINPFMSIFSADSTRKNGHPHAKVLRDFLTYSPILVDKENSFFVNFYSES